MDQKRWLKVVGRAVETFSTPFFLFSSILISQKLEAIQKQCAGYNATNWLSVKTLPVKKLLAWWRKTGHGVEVTSEYELLAVIEEGYSPEEIIVNGVAKHSWDKDVWRKGLRVNFDSLMEIELLSSLAKKLNWRTGLRFHPRNQKDPENRDFSDQFGIPHNELKDAIEMLNKSKITPDTIHLHLRSNIPDQKFFFTALDELFISIKELDLRIHCLDLGGGLPAEGVRQLDPEWESKYSLMDLRYLFIYCYDNIESLSEIVMENGRYLLAGCGVLVFTVNDVKVIEGTRYLICDGGRTNHAFVSDWEDHDVEVWPSKTSDTVLTAICGPTCMAYDCITRKHLPENIDVGDKILWLNAGAYHLPWETRFSQPLARVLWHDESDNILEIRPREDFLSWWGHWR